MDKYKAISFIKSGTRIIGFAIMMYALVPGVLWLIMAEIIGIVEELVV